MMPAMVMPMPRKPIGQALMPADSPPPALRPMFHPIKATNSTLGPGADCAKAIEDEKEASESQCFSSTK